VVCCLRQWPVLITAQIYRRSMPGLPGVHRRSMAAPGLGARPRRRGGAGTVREQWVPGRRTAKNVSRLFALSASRNARGACGSSKSAGSGKRAGNRLAGTPSVSGTISSARASSAVTGSGLQNRRLSLRWFEPNTCQQHLPPPAKIARELGIPGLAGCCFSPVRSR
jgi:hypothetical protein